MMFRRLALHPSSGRTKGCDPLIKGTVPPGNVHRDYEEDRFYFLDYKIYLR